MTPASNPYLMEINARVWVNELSRAAGRSLTLAEVPERELEHLEALGFDLVWLMGVWTTGPTGRAIALRVPELQQAYGEADPDWTEASIGSSPYAIAAYEVAPELGGPGALAELRERLARHGLGLMLDFVPNHVAIDHPWARQNPDWFVPGPVEPVRGKHVRLETALGPRVLSHGRDPYFPPWTDTLQLNYQHPELREALIQTLEKIAGQCDGVRCDMAMLVLQDVFHRTWGGVLSGRPSFKPARTEFWPDAISRVRRLEPRFLFLAEAYWGLEWQLQRQGFDYTYDKTFYDRVLRESGASVKAHLSGDPVYHRHKARFLENHDEPRAASVLSAGRHQAAAVLMATLPGMRFFHGGQLEGRRRRIPVQMVVGPREAPDEEISAFYHRLLATSRAKPFREGTWRMVDVLPLEPDPGTWEDVIAYQWEAGGEGHGTVIVNLSDQTARVRLPYSPSIQLRERFTDELMHFRAGQVGSLHLPLELGPYDFGIFVE